MNRRRWAGIVIRKSIRVDSPYDQSRIAMAMRRAKDEAIADIRRRDPMKPMLRVIANRPASNAPMPFREPEKPADAVNVMNAAALVVLALFGLAAIWALSVLVLSLERLS